MAINTANNLDFDKQLPRQGTLTLILNLGKRSLAINRATKNWPRVFLNSIDGFAFTLFVSESSFDCFYLVFELLDMTVLFSFSPSINEKYKVSKSHLCFLFAQRSLPSESTNK